MCVCVRPRCFLLHRNISVFGFPSFLHVCFSLVIQHRRFSVNSFSRHLINGKMHTSWQTSSFARQLVGNDVTFPEVAVLWLDCHYNLKSHVKDADNVQAFAALVRLKG